MIPKENNPRRAKCKENPEVIFFQGSEIICEEHRDSLRLRVLQQNNPCRRMMKSGKTLATRHIFKLMVQGPPGLFTYLGLRISHGILIHAMFELSRSIFRYG